MYESINIADNVESGGELIDKLELKFAPSNVFQDTHGADDEVPKTFRSRREERIYLGRGYNRLGGSKQAAR